MIPTKPDHISEAVERQFQTYAMECYPNEACAFVVNNEMIAVENIHEDPQHFFAMSTQDNMYFLKAQGFMHSHPNGESAPSAYDMQVQKAAAMPFGICAVTEGDVEQVNWLHDKLLDTPLEGRRFIHGIFDCYSLVRSHYKQNLGVLIGDIPRNYEWWEHGDNLIVDSAARLGFNPVEELEVNDLFLLSIASRVINHTAIYLGDNVMLHHYGNGVSCKEYVTKHAKRVKLILRYQ